MLPVRPAPEVAVPSVTTLDPPAQPEPERDIERAPVPGPGPGPVMVATARATYVYEAPDFSSRRLGYLRAGQVVRRATEPSGAAGCPGGFFEIVPRGHVCVGDWASLDPEHPAARQLSRRPDRSASLPYRYGLSRFPTPPFYTRVPSYSERASQEPELHYHVRNLGGTGWNAAGFDAVPAMLLAGGSAPRFDGQSQAGTSLSSGRAIPGSGFAFMTLFASDGYEYGISTDLAVLPLDRVEPVEGSRFHGVRLEAERVLPLGFVRTRSAISYEDPRRRPAATLRLLGFREAVALNGNRVRVQGSTYHEASAGGWIRDDQLVLVEPLSLAPSWVEPGRRWIDVSILRQTLVAYSGTEAVFATLVSTGKAGLSDERGAPATIKGTFTIHTKHVTSHMSSNARGNAYDLRDVPYVQYFHEGFALHAAYWHDAFGAPRSHGCVNLSPEDARWLFEWTDPEVPPEWHGAYSTAGTRVHIHP